MEFIVELIFEFILECVGYAITETKLKTWIKTVLFLVITQGVTAVLVLASVQAFNADINGGYVVAVLAVLWFVGTMIGVIGGHKRNWHQTKK